MRGPWHAVGAHVRTWWNSRHPIAHARVSMEPLHMWDEISAWELPRKPVACLYCHVLKQADNLREHCPCGPTANS